MNATPNVQINQITKSSTAFNYIKIENLEDGNANPVHFNYMEQYYEVQIEALNKKVNEMSGELRKYRELYSSKQSELDDLSDGLSSRICKENNEKNVLIKEINSNNIEIKRLK